MFARLLWRRGTRGQYTSSIIPTYFQLQLYTSMYYLSRRDAFKFASRFHDIAYPYGIVYHYRSTYGTVSQLIFFSEFAE